MREGNVASPCSARTSYKNRLRTAQALLGGRAHRPRGRPPCETKRKTPPSGGSVKKVEKGKRLRDALRCVRA